MSGHTNNCTLGKFVQSFVSFTTMGEMYVITFVSFTMARHEGQTRASRWGHML